MTDPQEPDGPDDLTPDDLTPVDLTPDDPATDPLDVDGLTTDGLVLGGLSTPGAGDATFTDPADPAGPAAFYTHSGTPCS